jgi:mannan endo-1,4-beta-mannosidase
LKALFEAVEKNVAANGPVAGTNIWSWGGEGRAHAADARWVEGRDFTGDPPQEPQGLNSIFDTDSSTLELIQRHAAALR